MGQRKSLTFSEFLSKKVTSAELNESCLYENVFFAILHFGGSVYRFGRLGGEPIGQRADFG
jgi:hypothetical protein